MMAFSALLALAAVAQPPSTQPTATQPLPTIVLDAKFEDWDRIQPITVDPVDAGEAAVEFGEVRVDADDNFVHLLIDFGRNVNLHGLDGVVRIYLNADGDDLTGPGEHALMGVDLVIECTPPDPAHPGRPGRGITARPTMYEPDANDPKRPLLNIYDLGLAFAPSYASRRHEFRIARGTFPNLAPLFQGEVFKGQVVFEDLHGSIMEETDGFLFLLPPRGEHASTQPTDIQQLDDPLARAPQTDLRTVSWNVELSSLITKPEPFIRTLKALDPDLIVLQELTDKTTIEQVAAVLQHIERPDSEPWQIMIGKGGGDLRCAIASRFPLKPVPGLDLLTYPDHPDRSVRAASALVDVQGREILVSSIHLKCCGRAGSGEDLTRLAEVELLQHAMKEAMKGKPPAGLVIAGDFNLVGSREPLENLMTGGDLDGSVLELVDAYQLDGRSNATWADRDQPFSPGRLDYAVVSGSTFKIARSFVFDALDLAPKWLDHHLCQSSDTDQASDHLPLVFDLILR